MYKLAMQAYNIDKITTKMHIMAKLQNHVIVRLNNNLFFQVLYHKQITIL